MISVTVIFPFRTLTLKKWDAIQLIVFYRNLTCSQINLNHSPNSGSRNFIALKCSFATMQWATIMQCKKRRTNWRHSEIKLTEGESFVPVMEHLNLDRIVIPEDPNRGRWLQSCLRWLTLISSSSGDARIQLGSRVPNGLVPRPRMGRRGDVLGGGSAVAPVGPHHALQPHLSFLMSPLPTPLLSPHPPRSLRLPPRLLVLRNGQAHLAGDLLVRSTLPRDTTTHTRRLPGWGTAAAIRPFACAS